MKRTILYQALTSVPELVLKLTPRMYALCAALQTAGHPDTVISAPKLKDWEVDESFQALLSLAVDKICLAIFVDGLDEFDTRPPDVVKLVESLASTDRHVKICVASRPWIEFDDAYRDVPKLQMHKHSANGMAVFVRERFRPCRGFSDFQHAYPTETTELLKDIHEKSNGVFT